MNSKSLASLFKHSIVVAVGTSVACAPMAAQAQIVTSLSDLIGRPSFEVQRELRARGYVEANSKQNGATIWEYWWNSQDNACVSATIHEGRSLNFVKTSSSECPQAEKPGMSDGAKVAIGAVALLGLAAIASNANKHNDDQNNENRSDDYYDRGYRNHNNHDGYPSSYYRPPNYGNGYQGGRPSYGSINDLVGSRASLVNGAMRDRGFSYTISSRSGANTFTHWKNYRTRQCVEIVTANNEVLGVNDLGSGSCR